MTRSRLLLLALLVSVASAVACGEETIKLVPGEEPAPSCGAGESLDPATGSCLVAGCDSDDDCPFVPVEQRCDLITGLCVPIEDTGEGGAGGFGGGPSCQGGRRRCAGEPAATCEDGACFAADYACSSDADCAGVGGGSCVAGRCSGGAACTTDGECPGGALESCTGGRWIRTECPVGGGCAFGACTVCPPAARRCVEGGTPLEYDECDESGTTWVRGTCADPAAICTDGYCRVCTPGTHRCLDGNTAQTCDTTGEQWTNQSCSGASRCDATAGAPTYGTCIPTFCAPGTARCGADPTTREICDASGDFFNPEACPAGRTCDEGSHQCEDPCSAAAAANSYKGCDFWLANLSNSQIDARFQDDYAVVVANSTPTPVTVTVSRAAGQVTQIQVAGNGIEAIRLPWVAFNGTGKQRTAYRLVSTAPITAYQFNPLLSADPSGCRNAGDCGFGEACLPGGLCELSDYSYSNDASLLLPAHIFSPSGTSSNYVAVSGNHERVSPGGDLPASMAVVATQPNTTVTIAFRGWSAAGGGIAAQARTTQQTYTMTDFDVLQFWTDAGGTSQSSPGPSGRTMIGYQSSFTGSVITSDKPIAVFGGADCTFMPYNKFACDHIEEQIFPFHTWGTEYVAARSIPLGNGQAPDYWRVVAGLGGTTVDFTPAVTLASGQQASRAQLNAGDYVELATTADFLVSSNNPVLVSQFFASQDVHGDTVGDPSLVLAPPTTQYRKDYLVLVPTTIAQNYLNIVAPQVGSRGPPVVSISSQAGSFTVSQWTNVPNTTWKVARQRLCNAGNQAPCMPAGVYSVTSTDPVGLTVYGFDAYVSYGYTGGLDLKQTVFVDPEF